MFEARCAPFPLPLDVARELAARYGEPHRAYHDATHIAAMLGWFDVVADNVGWQASGDVYLAIVFHDAIYDATAKDNEARSAQLARDLVAAGDRVVGLIELTARHGSLTPADVAADHDAALFLDCDLTILGADPATFDRYDAGVRIEYRHVPDDLFAAGRRAFLAKLAAQPRIYFSDFFHARLDAAARANLARKLRA
ncbi:MAG: hypothetical protein NT062_02235 [Proteobacteria bacterium]|nr:hypothetical protein [Pseudomonadota bacterium]